MRQDSREGKRKEISPKEENYLQFLSWGCREYLYNCHLFIKMGRYQFFEEFIKKFMTPP